MSERLKESIGLIGILNVSSFSGSLSKEDRSIIKKTARYLTRQVLTILDGSDRVEAARVRMHLLLRQNPPLSPKKPHWHMDERKEEISRYGESSVAHLVPPRYNVNARVLPTLIDNGIHTREELMALDVEDILSGKALPQRGRVPDSRWVRRVIADIRVLAETDSSGIKG